MMTMTEKLYLTDSYMKEVDAKVSKTDGNSMILDKTIFYPAGGGQPNDTGKILIGPQEYKVVDIKKEDNDVIHVLDRPAQTTVGSMAHCIIDWDRRYACMKYHTALHLIDGIMEKFYNSGMITGGQIYPDRAHMDMDMPGLTREKVSEILEKTNAVAKEGHEVLIKEIGADEAAEIPRLSRTETGRKLLQTLKTVRVVDIVGVDLQADGGTHVRNTGEIGTIELNAYENKGSRRKRIDIILK